jgi:hypothetical protein
MYLLISRMQTEYYTMPTSSLVDLLARQTERFTRLISENQHSGEYEELKTSIQTLQSIIESRMETMAPPTGTRV